MELTGKTVLLTGATGGIGHAIARRLRRAGATLTLTGRRAEVLAPLARELDATALTVDLGDPVAVAQLIADAGDVDVVVANAALPAAGLLTSFSTEDIDQALQVNLRTPIVMARHYAEAFRAKRAGHLLFISSISGKVGTPYSSMYSATKFGLRGFAQGLRAELATDGVGVSVVFPGFVRDAGMFADSGTVLPKGVGTSRPEQVADAVVDAIERNRGEVDVAPLLIRASAVFAGVAPELAAKVTRLVGGERIGADLAAGQQKKRPTG